MTTPTFVDILRSEVARMQAAHPEREGEIARAHAAIVEGHVVPVDAENGQVLSRNGSTWYSVNGVCTCEAASFGKPCRHLQAWKLFKHIQRQYDALQETAPPVETAPAPAPPTPPAETEPALGPLPEAAFSLTLKGTRQGQDALLTIRARTAVEFQAHLDAVRDLLDPVPAPASPAAPHGQGEGWCARHGVQMKQTTKEGRSWWSHRVDGAWCKGKGGGR